MPHFQLRAGLWRALPCALCLLALAACGGSSSASSTAGVTTTKGESPTSANPAIAPFGRPAPAAERAAILAALRAYLGALAADDGALACGHLAAGIRAEVAALGTSPGEGCAGQLATMYAVEAPATRAAQRRPKFGALGLLGERAFAFYRGPGGRREFFPLAEEHGSWGLLALGSSRLPPRSP